MTAPTVRTRREAAVERALIDLNRIYGVGQLKSFQCFVDGSGKAVVTRSSIDREAPAFTEHGLFQQVFRFRVTDRPGNRIKVTALGHQRTVACPASDPVTLESLQAELAAEKAKNTKLVEVLRDIGQYEGEGGPSTPWRQIVRDLGASARIVLAEVGQ